MVSREVAYLLWSEGLLNGNQEGDFIELKEQAEFSRETLRTFDHDGELHRLQARVQKVSGEALGWRQPAHDAELCLAALVISSESDNVGKHL